MGDRELYQQKMQAQLDVLKAELAKLKARASSASADVQLEMNKQIKALDRQIEAGNARLSELAKAGEDAWESMKQSVDSVWSSLKSAVNDAAAKFK